MTIWHTNLAVLLVAGRRTTSTWLALALALIVTMGVLTYYEHLHEPADEEDEPPSQIHLGSITGSESSIFCLFSST